MEKSIFEEYGRLPLPQIPYIYTLATETPAQTGTLEGTGFERNQTAEASEHNEKGRTGHEPPKPVKRIKCQRQVVLFDLYPRQPFGDYFGDYPASFRRSQRQIQPKPDPPDQSFRAASISSRNAGLNRFSEGAGF